MTESAVVAGAFSASAPVSSGGLSSSGWERMARMEERVSAKFVALEYQVRSVSILRYTDSGKKNTFGCSFSSSSISAPSCLQISRSAILSSVWKKPFSRTTRNSPLCSSVRSAIADSRSWVEGLG